MSSKTALIAGASGLVGNTLFKLLLNDDHYDKIKVVSRSSVDLNNEKIEEIILEDFDNLDEISDKLDANDFYISIGTTRRKAGSKEAFLKVDFDFPLKFAHLAKSQPSFQQFLVVTSLGANANSPIFYNMVKGKLEDELIALNLPSLKIFQPSLLLGERKEFRLKEEIGKGISSLFTFFVVGSKKRLWTISAEEVATAMVKVAKKGKIGFKRFKPKNMIKIAYK